MRSRITKSVVSLLVWVMLLSVIMVKNMNVSAADNTDESTFQYLYINEAEQSYGDLQSIVVSWGDGKEEISSMELILEDSLGNQNVISSVDNTEGIFLFQEYFEKGTYQVKRIRIIKDDATEEFSMDDFQVEAYFSVDEEVEETKKSEYIEMESISTENVEMQIVSLDSVEETVVQEEISTALQEAESLIPATLSSEVAEQENIVVVLDPGHDSKHAGARGNGVKEEVATLKIAKYCKAELEKYDGVTVYLTRTGASCPFPDSDDNLDDIEERVKWAKEKGADVFVSIHLNSSPSSSAKGAEVYYSKTSTPGKKLAQKIQTELVKVGLYNREIKNNGAYKVIATAKKCGFPGIIVEHAFLSNSSDASKYLKTEAGLKRLGIADATGIAKYYELVKIGTKKEIPEGTYTFENVKAEGKLITVSKTEEVEEIEETEVTEVVEQILLNKDEQLESQKFVVESAGSNYYYLSEKETGRVLTVNDGTITLETLKKGNKKQKWAFIAAGNGSCYIRSASGLYLDTVSAEGVGKIVIGNESTEKKSQKWVLDETGGALLKQEKPILISTKYDDAAITVKWKSVAKAEGYYIYRKVSGGSWKKIGTVTSGTKVTYKDTSISKNKIYYYRVRAYRGDVISSYYTTGIRATTPAVLLKDPKVTSAKQTSETVKLTWEKTVNAKGYYIYRKVSGGSWKKIGTVASGKIFTYKDKTITAGKTYYYRIKAYSGKVSSGYSNSIKVATLKNTKQVME